MKSHIQNSNVFESVLLCFPHIQFVLEGLAQQYLNYLPNWDFLAITFIQIIGNLSHYLLLSFLDILSVI